MCNRLLIVALDKTGNSGILGDELMGDAPVATRKTVEHLKALQEQGVAAVVVEVDYEGYFLGLRADLATVAAKPDPMTAAIQGILKVLEDRLPAPVPPPAPAAPAPDAPPAP
jgi:hypothetical protein